MEISEGWKNIGRDDKRPDAVALDRELTDIHKSILEDESKIIELQRSAFYKQQMLEQLFSQKNECFNGIVPTRFILKEHKNGTFMPENLKTKHTKEVLTMLVANFFPYELWKKIEFIEAIGHVYEEFLDLSFSWEYKKGKFVEFKIELFNPDTLKLRTFALTDLTDHEALEYFKKFDLPYTTKVHVNYDYDPKKKNLCKTYDCVCSEYLNTSIQNKILEKVDDIVRNADEAKKKEKK